MLTSMHFNIKCMNEPGKYLQNVWCRQHLLYSVDSMHVQLQMSMSLFDHS